jgi:hypothetical protein
MKDLKFEIGDLVKIRDDLVDGKVYGTMFYIKYMKFEGFKKVEKLNNIMKSMCIKPNNDSHYYNYTKEMIEEVKRPIKYETIYKREEPILDEKEKEYLGNLIRPFRDKIILISKRENERGQYIIINILARGEDIYLPNFKKNTMYKNMKLDKDYTLEELGL